MSTEPIDLESFRNSVGLIYRKLAELIGVTQGRLAMAYALGEMWPDAYRLENIVRATDGQVSVEAMHKRRLQWLRERDAKSGERGTKGGQQAAAM